MTGSIFRCGIPGIEGLAAQELTSVRQNGLHPKFEAHGYFLDSLDMVEISVRMNLRARLEKGAIQGLEVLSGSTLQIWFDLTYPTPPVLAAH